MRHGKDLHTKMFIIALFNMMKNKNQAKFFIVGEQLNKLKMKLVMMMMCVCVCACVDEFLMIEGLISLWNHKENNA